MQRPEPFSDRRRRPGVARRVLRILSALGQFLADRVARDVAVVVSEVRLFLGLTLVLGGILSFRTNRYCDGNVIDMSACTRPATYYYYPFWAIVFVVLGGFLICLWYLRRTRQP